MKILIALLLLITSVSATALDDTEENRRAQAARYFTIMPSSEMMKDITEKMSHTVPKEEREMFVALMTKHVNMDVLDHAMTESMVKHMTANELKAMADFYATPEGKSVMSKFGVYMADVMPVVQQEIMRAQKEVLNMQQE